VHSYTTTFWWTAAILTGGAVLVGTVLKPGVAAPAAFAAGAEPVLVH
jgi:hypothetical protein